MVIKWLIATDFVIGELQAAAMPMLTHFIRMILT